MKSINNIKFLAILILTFSAVTSCTDDHDHDDHDHEEELITTVNYKLTNGNDVVTLTFSDPDGDGGNDGEYSVSAPLKANTVYTGMIELLNESESPAENITDEIKIEDDEHEFFYTSNIAGLTISKTDEDGNGNPLGIETSVTTGAAGSGTLTVVLKHEPKKPNVGLSDAGGSTDLQVTFNISVE